MNELIALSFSMILLLAAIAVGWVRGVSRGLSAVLGVLGFVLLVSSGSWVVADYFTGRGINDAVIYHLKFGLEGAGFGEYVPLIAGTLFYLVMVSALSVVVIRRLWLRSGRTKEIANALTLALLAGAFVVNPANRDLLALGTDSSSQPDALVGVPEQYRIPQVVPGEGEKNLVFVYLEGLERTYLDEDLFPGLTPNLKALERDAWHFTDLRQGEGMGWTIAGITASQCGIPLYTPAGGGNSLSGVDQFLPGAHCMGDVLAEAGYRLEFMGGASLEFAGKGQFFKSHGFTSVMGRDELTDRLEDPGYQSSWGLYDDSLFSLARQRFHQLASTGYPFGLFLLNLDTHHPTGHESATCRDHRYRDGTNSILNAIHCADFLIDRFVQSIRESGHAEDTLVVLVSDHLAMKNTAWDQLKQGERRNLLMILDPSSEQAKAVDKPGWTADVAPTVLARMGFDVSGLGLGRDLLTAPSSLIQQEDLGSFLSSLRPFIRQLWSHPQLNEGMRVIAAREEVRLGERKLRFPVLLQVDDEGRVDSAVFEFSSSKLLVDHFDESRSPEQSFVWIDRCEKVMLLSDRDERSAEDWCVGAGRLGAEELLVRAVDGTLTLTLQELSPYLGAVTGNNQRFERRLRTLAAYRDSAGAEAEAREVTVDTQGRLRGSVRFRSGSGPYDDSFVASAVDGKPVELVRGLTLLGFDQARRPIKLAHIDTCQPVSAAQAQIRRQGSFAEVIGKSETQYGAFAIVAQDSPLCDPLDLTPLFEGLQLEKWRELKLRQPYIAVLAGDGSSREWVGEAGNSLMLSINNFIAPDPIDFSHTLDSGVTGPEERSSRAQLPNIAHAGGGYRRQTYTNSLEALNHNAARFELFEIDLSMTADDDFVCLHDWEGSFERSFGVQTEAPVTLAEFRHLIETRSNLEKCTLDSLAAWLKGHPSARIVTDSKEDNEALLEAIAARFPELLTRFIPQIYQPEEYTRVRELGYEDIIWTLYQYQGSNRAVLDWLDEMELFALTMPRHRADQGLARSAYEAAGVLSYVHTINERHEADAYLDKGAAGIYTDWLHDWP